MNEREKVRKPPARKIAILLIVLAILTVFIVDSFQQGITVFLSIGLFFDRMLKALVSCVKTAGISCGRGEKNCKNAVTIIRFAEIHHVTVKPYRTGLP